MPDGAFEPGYLPGVRPGTCEVMVSTLDDTQADWSELGDCDGAPVHAAEVLSAHVGAPTPAVMEKRGATGAPAPDYGTPPGSVVG